MMRGIQGGGDFSRGSLCAGGGEQEYKPILERRREELKGKPET